jgi:hypothetical protein
MDYKRIWHFFKIESQSNTVDIYQIESQSNTCSWG